MTDLTGVGTIEYNGFAFNGPRVRSSLSVRPVRDRADRNVTHDIYTITVHAIVSSDSGGQTGGTVDPQNVIQDMEYRLTQDGGILKYTGQGHGDLQVNTSNTDRDISYGPKPQLLNLKQIGSLYVHEVDWTVTTAIKRCSAAAPVSASLGNIIEFLYGVDYSVDVKGLITRTVSGYYKVALNRNTSNPPGQIIQTNADFAREKIAIIIPPRFQRISQNWRLSDDKSMMEFTIVDQEKESDNAYPEGVVDMRMSHSVSAKGPVASRHHNSINGSVTIARPFPKSFAFDRILLILRQRLLYARRFGSIIITSFEITEEIFERSISFNLRYSLLGELKLRDNLGFRNLLRNSGLFTPVQSTNFVAWGRSLENSAWHNRGSSRLRHNQASDRIVDNCNQLSSARIADGVSHPYSNSRVGYLSSDCPKKKQSYLAWTNNIEVESNRPMVVHRPMSPQGSSIRDFSLIRPPWNELDLPGDNRIASNVRTEIPGYHEVTITIKGHGMRAGYTVEIPKIVKIFGQRGDALRVEMNRVRQGVVGNMGGCIIYAAEWTIKYVVDVVTTANLEKALRGEFDDMLIETAQVRN